MFKVTRWLLACCVLCVIACSKVEDHNSINNPQLGKDLLQQVNENPNLSRFAELIVKSGYDKVLAASKTFTVWAPTNAALASLDAATVNDTAKLRLFISNHIATQMYTTTAATSGLRVAMLNGKYNNFKGTTIEDANVTDANHYAKNGLLHIIDKALPALSNTWETMAGNTAIPVKQRDFMLSLLRNVFDTTNAIKTGVNPLTGQPIYQAGTDSIRTNLFWRNVYDLRNESGQYTLFVVADTAFDGEIARYRPYYATGTTDSTTNLAGFDVVKDYAFAGLYPAASLPDTLVSASGVKVGINKANIIQSIKTSNGIIHIIRTMPVRAAGKLREFIIQAENYRSTVLNRRSNTYFRDKFNPLTNSNFRDVLVINHGVAQFWMNYQISSVNSVKYRAYWVAYNDFQTATHQQKLSIGDPLATNLPYVTVPTNTYDEQFIGEFTLPRYNPTLDIYLTAANSTTQAVNPIVCDYIRLVPVP